MNWYQKQCLLKIANQQDFNWKQEFLTKLQDILQNQKSKAAMMTFLMMTIFPMIDGFNLDTAEKEELKNNALNIEQAVEQQNVNLLSDVDTGLENKENPQLTPEQIAEQKRNELIDSTMKMTKFFESSDKPDGYPTVYLDTKGVPTIGHGLNLKERRSKDRLENLGYDFNKIMSGQQSLSQEHIDSLFRDDVIQSVSDAEQYLPNFHEQPELVQRIVTDMTFNMGLPTMKGFKGMKKALLVNDYDRAAEEMKYKNADTKDELTDYYKETGRRAKQLYNAMKNLGRNM